MGIFLTVLMFLGFAVGIVGSILFLVAAFREHVLWGLAVLFVPFANVVFLVKYWYEARQGFSLQLLGTGIMIAAMFSGIGMSMDGIRAQVAGGGPLPIPSEFLDARAVKAEQQLHESVLRKADERSEGDYTGLTLREVRNRLGAPRGKLEANGVVTYFYPGMELVSEDGETVAQQVETTE